MGVHDISEMPKVMRRYAESVETQVEKAVYGLVDTALKSFIEGTPVDTNRAVSNWRVSVGSRAVSFVPTRSPGATGGDGSGWVKSDVMMDGQARVRSWKVKTNKTIYVQNNAPYIMKLEHGSSRTQPGMFIASGLQAMAQRAKSIEIIKQL